MNQQYKIMENEYTKEELREIVDIKYKNTLAHELAMERKKK
jgi:hypothetical protein